MSQVEALPCPRCHKKPLCHDDEYFCNNAVCLFAWTEYLTIEKWNALPRYTAADLQAAIAEGIKVCLSAVEAEAELPGEPPKGFEDNVNRVGIPESLRVTVRMTKRGIIQRIKALDPAAVMEQNLVAAKKKKMAS